MKILLSASSWNPVNGGPFASIGNLALHLATSDNEVHLLTVDYPKMAVQPPPENVSLHVIEGKIVPGIRQTYLRNPRRRIRALIEQIQPDIIHDNGIWLALGHEMALAARRHAVPRMVSPRGMLNPWALNYQKWKKQIALKLFQQRDLESTDGFHATSAQEAESIRTFGLKQTISTIPNGVNLPENASHFQSDDHRTALFLGRLHPVKNLPTLIRAWASVRPDGWKLKLAGPDEVNHRAALEQLSAQLGVNDCVEISGPVYGDAKQKLLAEAQLAFLVSKSENFGISAAEALASGVPVIASKALPWSCLEEANIGWWIDGEIEPLATAIAEATRFSEADLQAMGIKGRHYAQEHFSWDSIAEQFLESYRKVIDAY